MYKITKCAHIIKIMNILHDAGIEQNMTNQYKIGKTRAINVVFVIFMFYII